MKTFWRIILVCALPMILFTTAVSTLARGFMESLRDTRRQCAANAPDQGVSIVNVIKWDRKPITVAGIYSGVPFEVYHHNAMLFGDDPSISSSGLRTIVNESPAHYWAYSPFNPRRVQKDDDTEALAFGRAAHLLLCRQPDFKAQFVEQPRHLNGKLWSSNSTQDRGAWNKAQKAAGRTIIKPEQVETIKGMVTTLGRSELFLSGMLDGHVELSMFWRDPQTGVWLKSRPDVIPNDSGDFVDLKTTLTVHFPALQRTIAEYGYDQQAALTMFLAQQLGLPAQTFTLLFLEKKPPYCMRGVQLADVDLLVGDDLNRRALQIFAANFKRFRADPDYQWPGPGGDDIQYLELPQWAKDQRKNWLEFNKVDEAA